MRRAVAGGFLQLTTTTRDDDSSELSWAGDLISTVADMSVGAARGGNPRGLVLYERRDVQLSCSLSLSLSRSGRLSGLVGAGCGYSVTDHDPSKSGSMRVVRHRPPRRGEEQRSFQNTACFLTPPVAYPYDTQTRSSSGAWCRRVACLDHLTRSLNTRRVATHPRAFKATSSLPLTVYAAFDCAAADC